MEYPFVLKSSLENKLEEDIEIGIKAKAALIFIDGGRNENCKTRFRHVQNHIRQNLKLATQIE
ncbi:hypothetical protein WAX78_02855 [Bacillus sp. FJAT-53711]|uniref:Uncharacterized protein n=1 Tax=Bacillus yunxiaonensis TaxID=3127665 RepID=A0ABU8FRF4_9BACI